MYFDKQGGIMFMIKYGKIHIQIFEKKRPPLTTKYIPLHSKLRENTNLLLTAICTASTPSSKLRKWDLGNR